jgi:hypothetical protein
MDKTRRQGLGMVGILIVQYVLGMIVNIYVTVPKRDQGASAFTAIGRAIAHGPVGLTIHTILGLLLVIGALQFVVTAVLGRDRVLIGLTVVGFISMIGAAMSGAGFVGKGDQASTMGMAAAWALALICYLVAALLPVRATKS